MRRLVLPALTLLAACQQAQPVNQANQAAPAPKAAPPPESDVAAAERLVRHRLGGDPNGIRFVEAKRSASSGVGIVCGAYEQSGAHQRYIVVNREDVFVEPQMRPGEMDRAVAEFCREGTDNRPPPTLNTMGNAQ